MKTDVVLLAKEAIIDGDLLKLLKRSRQGQEFNLYGELEKKGYSADEITKATIRELQRRARELRRISDILLTQAIVEGLLSPDDLK